MSVKIFRLIALTPVHVGTGEAITPEEFFTDDRTNEMVRFRPEAALSAMSGDQRTQFSALIDQNRMDDALVQLRTFAQKAGESHIYRIKLSDSSKPDLQAIIGKLDTQKGDVRPLPRNPFNGRIIIPGSGIKGAIRTALMSKFVEELLSNEPRLKDEIHRKSGFELKRAWSIVQQRVFGAQNHGQALDRDPFRHLKVSDVEVDPALAVISRAQIYKRDGSAGAEKIRMYFERLMSSADGVPGVLGTVSIKVISREDRDNKLGKVSREFSWAELSGACSAFYSGRMQAEANGFGWLYTGWALGWKGSNKPAFYLRLGRFNHFDSLSVNGIRRGQGFKGKPLFESGSSRTACELVNGRKAPFGWVVLEEV